VPIRGTKRRTFPEEDLAAASIVFSPAEVARTGQVLTKHPAAGARYGSADLTRTDGGRAADRSQGARSRIGRVAGLNEGTIRSASTCLTGIQPNGV